MAETVIEERDVELRREGGQPLLAHVYTPRGEGPFPALLDVHGGAWSGGDRMSNARLDRELAALGLVVVAVDFRLAPAHPYPAMMQDLNYATRWVKAQAAALNVRPAGVGAIGTSSGGHMAVLGAVRPHDERYAALPLEGAGAGSAGVDASLDYVVACWPPIDPHDRAIFAQLTGRPELVRNTEGCFLTVEAMHDASPTRIVATGRAQALPPVLVVQGTADGNIPMPMIERFAAAYRAAGGALRLEVFEGQPHGFTSRPGPEAERAVRLIKEFVLQQVAAPAV